MKLFKGLGSFLAYSQPHSLCVYMLTPELLYLFTDVWSSHLRQGDLTLCLPFQPREDSQSEFLLEAKTWLFQFDVLFSDYEKGHKVCKNSPHESELRYNSLCQFSLAMVPPILVNCLEMMTCTLYRQLWTGKWYNTGHRCPSVISDYTCLSKSSCQGSMLVLSFEALIYVCFYVVVALKVALKKTLKFQKMVHWGVTNTELN